MNGIEKDENSSKIRNPENKKLVFAHSIWRHGKRTPLIIYRTSLIKEEDFAHGLGELIHVSFAIRTYYKHNQRLKISIFYDRVTASQRCILKRKYPYYDYGLIIFDYRKG